MLPWTDVAYVAAELAPGDVVDASEVAVVDERIIAAYVVTSRALGPVYGSLG